MQKHSSYYNNIITKQGGKQDDWEKLLKSINLKLEE